MPRSVPSGSAVSACAGSPSRCPSPAARPSTSTGGPSASSASFVAIGKSTSHVSVTDSMVSICQSRQRWSGGKRVGTEEDAVVETLPARRRRLMRADIERVAMRMFLDRGYDAVSVDDIAEAVGMSSRTFFRYYATKDEVLSSYRRGLSEALVDA